MKRLLNQASLRGKFLVAPTIALITMIVLAAIFTWKLFELQEGHAEIESHDLVLVQELSDIAVRVSQIHSKTSDILLAARDGADEEAVYEIGKPLLEGLLEIEATLQSNRTNSEAVINTWDGYDHAVDDFVAYKNVVISAIEMATVNTAVAKEQIIAADDFFSHFVTEIQGGVKSLGQDIGVELGEQRQAMAGALQSFVFISVVAIIITIVVSLSLSNTLSGEIESLIVTMAALTGGDKSVRIPAVSGGKELTALADGVAAFQQSLRKIDEQKIEFEQNNILLLWEINERKKADAQLLETRAHFQYLLDNNPTLIYSATPHGEGLEVIYVSENARKVVGIEAAELLGDRRLWNDKMSIGGGKALFNEQRELFAKKRVEHDYQIINKKGEELWVRDALTWTGGEDGKAVEIIGSLTNVTSLKMAEERLQELNGELVGLAVSLEEKVKIRTADLEKANQDLQRLSAAKSEFISIVSHDLRTPLTGVKLFTDIMLDDIDNIDRETQVEYLSIISAETDRLSRLITNILDFQKISAGKMQWNDEEVDLAKVVAECTRPFRISFESKGVAFEYECSRDEIITVIDADRFSQVVYNLLSNALKFTERGSVRVKLEMIASVDGERILLSVADTGPGLPAEMQKKIFEPFEQYGGVPNLGKGTGLGLYITNCVVERYHGRAWVESELGRGSTFHVELPVRKQQHYVI